LLKQRTVKTESAAPTNAKGGNNLFYFIILFYFYYCALFLGVRFVCIVLRNMERILNQQIVNADGVNCGMIAVIRVIAHIRLLLELSSRSKDAFAAVMERHADDLLAGKQVDVRSLRGAFATATFDNHDVRKIMRDASSHEGQLDPQELLLLYARTSDNNMGLDTLMTTTSLCSCCGASSTSTSTVTYAAPIDIVMGDINGHAALKGTTNACPSCMSCGTMATSTTLRPSRMLIVQVAADNDKVDVPALLELTGDRIFVRCAGMVHTPRHWRSVHADKEGDLVVCGSMGVEPAYQLTTNKLNLPGADAMTLVFLRNDQRLAPTIASLPIAMPQPAAAPRAPTSLASSAPKTAATTAATSAAATTAAAARPLGSTDCSLRLGSAVRRTATDEPVAG
jgi:hypothetical protein